MNTRQAITVRIIELCNERHITPNALSYRAGVPQSTIKSILNDETQNPGVVTIKKICDGLGITLSDFFATDTSGSTVKTHFRHMEKNEIHQPCGFKGLSTSE
jgi:transcriptional regulator with XRE-family HTH domain